MRYIIYLLACVYVTVTKPAAAQADACDAPMRVMTTNVPPLVEIKYDKPVGELTDEVTAYLSSHLSRFSIKHANWARTLKYAEQGRVDAIFPTMYSEERAQYLDFSIRAFSTISIGLYAKASTLSTDLELSRQDYVAVIRAVNFDQSVLNGARVVEVTDAEQAVKMLEKGRVDYVVGVSEIIKHIIDTNTFTDVSLVKKLEEHPVYLALSKNALSFPLLKACLIESKQD